MYELQQVFTFDYPIELPDCMYSLPNIHNNFANESVKRSHSACTKNSGNFEKVELFLKNIENIEMTKLLEKQEKLLNQLEELKKIMQSIKSNLKLPSNSSPDIKGDFKENNTIPFKQKLEISDIVLNVDPLYPPYYLIFLQQLLKDQISLNVNCYLHSSISELPGKCKSVMNNLKSSEENGIPSINITLIWKNIGPGTEMNTIHFPIQGEANILRYFARLLNNDLNYENLTNPEKIDTLLDTSYIFSTTNSRTLRSNIIQRLDKSLGKSTWLGDQNNVTIADIAMYDSLKKFANTKDLSGNLSKWFYQCQQLLK